jgi:hypothetical protein
VSPTAADSASGVSYFYALFFFNGGKSFASSIN